ncbi:unnamed protein product [Rhodiola kirilowii]
MNGLFYSRASPRHQGIRRGSVAHMLSQSWYENFTLSLLPFNSVSDLFNKSLVICHS